jgi:hypothetical protein
LPCAACKTLIQFHKANVSYHGQKLWSYAADNACNGGRITKRLWKIGDIVDVLEAWEAARQHDAVAA